MKRDYSQTRRRLLSSLAGLGGLAAFTDQRAAAFPSPTPSAAWAHAFDPNRNRPTWDPRALPVKGDVVHEYDLEIVIAEHEIVPRIAFHAYAFNGQVPGPLIRVKEGDWIQVNLTNKTHDFHTIHWHGMYVPCEMDGIPLGTQYPVGYGETFRYLWRAQPAGTHFYHCHNMTNMHIQAGLYGALIVESHDDPVRRVFGYDREYVMVLSEVDTNFIAAMMNDMLKMGHTMSFMAGSGGRMAAMNGEMMGWFASTADFEKSVKSGWIPPYDPSLTGDPMRIRPNFFMINGKSWPMTEHLHIRRGENIRVRLINTGLLPHAMHLHGHDVWEVCRDGAPLASPVRLNTIPVMAGSTVDFVVQGTNAGNWHFHDHSDLSLTNNGVSPGGMMTMLMYDDADQAGFTFKEIIAVNS
ncbi:MAG: multicopper oxidase domain-containing protein [Armatimonadetes bacterium]|nr:multicopper oxidase domain-containing protein [Armatimonadota bacterium]MDE2205551.1 multicopper oxidase domain-containing protein [Armatimonadota bacterium]